MEREYEVGWAGMLGEDGWWGKYDQNISYEFSRNITYL